MGNVQTRDVNHNRVIVKLLVQDDGHVKVWIIENDINMYHDLMMEYRRRDIGYLPIFI